MWTCIRKWYQDEQTFRAVLLSLIAGGILLAVVQRFFGVLGPFLAAIVLSALLNSSVTRLQKLGIPRFVGSGFLVVTLVILILLVLGVFSVFLQKYLVDCSKHIPATVTFLANWIPQKLRCLNDVAQQLHLPLALDGEKIRATLLQSLGGLTETLVRYTASVYEGAKSFMSVLSFLFFVPILTFYLLKDWPKIMARGRSYLSHHLLAFVDYAGPRVKTALKSQLKGQFKVSCLVFVLYSLGLSLLGVHAFLFLGFLSAVLTFIPFIGIFIAFVIAFIVGLSQGLGPMVLLAIVALYFVGSSLESNFLTPRLVGAKVGLHPVWIFFAVLMTLACLGLGGALFVMPLATLIGSLVQSTLQWLQAQEAEAVASQKAEQV